MQDGRTQCQALALTLFLLIGGASAVPAQDAVTSPPFPPPGRLIDVGGWRLHLNCTGEPRPSHAIVILEAGAGDFSVDWSLVQPGVARFARVCSYDRAGSGWSELGPQPRTMTQIAYEFHANDPPRDKLPADAQRMRTWSYGQVKMHISNDNPFEADELEILRQERTRTEHVLGDIPLIVLSRGVPEDSSPAGQAGEQEHNSDQAALVALSRIGKRVVAKRSGHHIPLDEPDLVVAAIRDVIAATHR
jgi:pimeloyl-ACP methyl ester carboxylesterase